MHSYQHNIKTFNHATRHLTGVERMFYRELIELYYDTEHPLPAVDFDALCRRVLARSAEEKTAVDYVLDEFFVRTGDVYSHDYCDEVIEKYRTGKTLKAKAGKASADARAEKSKQRKKDRSNGIEQPLNERSTEGQQNPTNKEPGTINQKPVLKDFDQSEIDRCFELFWLAGMKKIGKKKAAPLFKKYLTENYGREGPTMPTIYDLTNQLINDVHARIKSNQLGFTEMHPTTYFNGERMNDEIVEKRIEINNTAYANRPESNHARVMRISAEGAA